MISTAMTSERLFEAYLRQGQVKHAVKTALACCLATVVAYYFHLPSRQFAPLFAFLLLTLGMPNPRINWLLTQVGIVLSASASAVILIAFYASPFLWLAVTLLWIFTCLLLSNWFPLPGTLGAMVSAIGLFVFIEGTVGATVNFFYAYGFNFLIGGLAVVVVNTLLWPATTQKVFLQRLATVYAYLEDQCRDLASRVRSGDPTPAATSTEEWAPFRPLRQLLAPELRRARNTSNPFARMILTCRALIVRLWFFDQAVAPAAPAALSAETRQQVANLLERCAEHLHVLLEGALQGKAVPAIDAGLLGEVSSARRYADRTDVLFVHGIHAVVLHRLVQDLEIATASHNALFASFRKGLAGQFVALWPAASAPLLNVQSVRSSTKLVLLLLLLFVEEEWLRFPGGSQVAFFATFFASTGNLGRQNKTDLVGIFGLLLGFAYGVVAAFLTSRLPHFALLLALVFLGQFLAILAFQRLPRFGVAGLQAGLALPFAYLATTGPEWGSFDGVRVRFEGLVLAGFTAVVVHAYLWPVLPMRQLRALIAAALRDTAVSLAQLFAGPRAAWQGAPPSLGETVARARDLLDDARYLPGSEYADPAFNGILRCIHEIDASLEFIHFLIGLEQEHPLRQRFFEVIGDYAEQARTNLATAARHFELPPRRAARIETVRWAPDTSGRWENASHDVGPDPDAEIDPWRPAVIARCLDQIAQAVERISEMAREINLRNSGR
jgi:uncharacterized membrane protein YccC